MKTGPGLNAYHIVWLEAHPSRSMGWLRARLADGFDIHHLDGDRNNNGPDNLVLMDHEDHMRWHRKAPRRVIDPAHMSLRLEEEIKGPLIYRRRATTRDSWHKVAADHGMTVQRTMNAAQVAASDNGWVWPIPKPVDEARRDRMAARGRGAYDMRAATRERWSVISAALGDKNAYSVATTFARKNNLPWPLPGPEDVGP